MKHKILLLIAFILFSAFANCQSYVQKHKGGDWYYGIGGGFSQSLAENAVSTDFIFHQLPSFDMTVGHNFTPVLGLKLTGSVNTQVSRSSESAKSVLPNIYGDGKYGFRMLTATLTGTVNITNIFWGYDVERALTWSFLMGAGVVKTFGFDDKLALWNKQPYYPVDTNGGRYLQGHIGMQCAARLNEAWDLEIELRTNATDNKYNGVSNGNHIDFYLDLTANFVYHFKNRQQLRRFREPKRAPFVDPIMADHSREYRETVRIGESMLTEIPFYAGFYYLNATTTKRVELVAKFLQTHPLINLNIVGHPDITADDDFEYHQQLAQKRANAVRNLLVDRFRISPDRLRVSYDDKALQQFKSVREWVPAVNFVMEMAPED